MLHLMPDPPKRGNPRLICRYIYVVPLLCLCGVASCSRADSKLNVTGKVVKGGSPLTVPEDEYVRVTFFPVTDGGSPPKNTYAADFNRPNGTFRALGGDGRGI